MKKNMIECDHEKLCKLIEKRGLTMAEASRELGYNHGFLSNTKQRKQINKTAALLLEKIYNIKPEEYAFTKEEKKEAKQQNEKIVNITENELYKIVYSAMYHALKRVEKEKQNNE